MLKRAALIAGFVMAAIGLSGCVNTTADALYLEPTGQAQITGKVPDVSKSAVAETQQMTPQEKAALKNELAASVRDGRAQAASNSPAAYQSEVAKLRRDAAALRKRRLQQIQNSGRINQ